MKSNLTPIIKLESLSFAYGKHSIFENLNLTIEREKFTVIAGESGSGKSTLLYILGGFQKYNSGNYWFEDQKVYHWGEIGLGRFRKKFIGFLFQDFRLLPFLTVEQNIKFPSYFSSQKVDRSHLQNLMNRLGLAHRARAYPSMISGGEAQRTALARALFLNPRVLLLDEPTGNLDLKTESEIIALLKLMVSEGLTVICVSHSPRLIEAADSVYHLQNKTLEVFSASQPRPSKTKKRRSKKTVQIRKIIQSKTVKRKSSTRKKKK